MAVRMKDIARDLGVSTVTVSKVMRGHPDIGPKTRALVQARMRELNYRPNMMARGLASGRSNAVGLVVPDLVHPFFGEFAKALGMVLRENGMALVLASSEEDPQIERQEIRTLLSRGVDVMVVASCAEGHPEVDGAKTPLVLVDRSFPGMGSFVGSDDVAVGEVATRHLIEIGRRRIAHLGGEGISPSVNRALGYRMALAAAGIDAPEEYVVTRARFEEAGEAAGYEGMQELLRLPQRPDAVFCYNDQSAIGAMKATLEVGLRIPEDVAFVGCGNLRYAEYLRVPLTSVDHSTRKMGEAAARMALALSENPDRQVETVLIEPELVVRESTVRA